jgi:hypothetical protein
MPILSQENILGSFLPTIYISKITLNETKVDLELMIIDTSNSEINEGTFSIINDEILKDCVTINVYESVAEENTAEILSGIIKTQVVQQQEFVELGSGGYTRSFSVTESNFSQKQQIYLSDYLLNNRFEIDEDGNKKFYYSISFERDTTNLEHLSYITICDVDSQALQDKFSLTLTTEQLSDIPKKVNGEIVINESQVVSDSYVYFLGESIWLGEVIYLEGQYQTLETPARILNKVLVSNNKIQDFRLRKNTQQNTTSKDLLDKSSTAIEREVSIVRISQQASTRRLKRVFEEPIKYVNSDGTISISLLIDIEEMIRQNCLFSNIPNLETEQKNIINNMSLYRRQISDIKLIDGQTIIEPLETSTPVVIEQDFNDNIISSNIGGYVHFKLNDQTIKDITHGKYQYGVQINFEDPTIEVVRTQFKDAIATKKTLLEYFKFCENFIDRKTFNFKNEISSIWSEDRVNNIVQRYIEIYTKLYSLSQEEKISLSSSLRSNINPITGSLDGIDIFLKMFDDLIEDIGKLLSITSSATDLLNLNDSDINNLSTKPSIQILKYFPNLVHDASQFTKIKLKYFDINLGTIEQEHFYNRINELIQYTNNEELYVNPKSILFYNEEFDFKQIKNATDQINNWIAGFVVSALPFTNVERELSNKLIQESKYRFIRNIITDISKERNVVDNLQVTKNMLLDVTSRPDMPGSIDSALIGSKLPRQINNTIQNNIFNDYSVSAYHANKQVTTDIQRNASSLTIGRNYTEVILDKLFNQKNEIDTTQSRNRILSQQRILDTNDEETKFKYLMLDRIEYLNKDLNDDLIWEPLTIEKLFNNLAVQTTASNIVCRLSRYTYSNEISQTNSYNFPYTNHFILRYTRDFLQRFFVVPELLPAPAPTTQIQIEAPQRTQEAPTPPPPPPNISRPVPQVNIVGTIFEDNLEFYVSRSVLRANNYKTSRTSTGIYEIIDYSNNRTLAISPELRNISNLEYSFDLSNRPELQGRRVSISLKIFNTKKDLIYKGIIGKTNPIYISIPLKEISRERKKAETQTSRSVQQLIEKITGRG